MKFERKTSKELLHGFYRDKNIFNDRCLSSRNGSFLRNASFKSIYIASKSIYIASGLCFFLLFFLLSHFVSQAQIIPAFNVLPDDDTAGVSTTYDFTFNTDPGGSGLPADGSILVNFDDAGFNVNNVAFVSSSLDGGLTITDITGQQITLPEMD